MSAPGVSVIIPSFNAARFVGAAVESVLNQKYEGVAELIVVDDGSTDDTIDVLRRYGDRLRLSAKKNGGVSSARNVGLHSARNEFVALLDADDLMKPGRLASQVAALLAQPEAVMCCSSIEHIGEDGELLVNQPKQIQTRYLADQLMVRRLFERNFVATSSVMLLRAQVQAIGGFNERLTHSEDCELWLRLTQCGSLVLLPERLTQYRIHGTQSINNLVAMALGRLMARASFLERYPAQRNALGAAYVSSAMAAYAMDSGYSLFRGGDAPAARRACRLGIRYAPLSMRLWRMYIRSFLPLRSGGRNPTEI